MMDPSDKVSDRALLVLDIGFLFDPIIHILADRGLLCFLLSQGFESDEVNSSGSKRLDGVSSDENSIKKTCADCGTTKTPLWRGGPAGPKSLCNACGIRSRKKRRAILGITKEEKKSKRGNSNSSSNSSSNKLGDSLKQRLYALGREVLMQRSSVEKQRKTLGEEEQAAVLLMALSYGSVYA
ncbi:GATA transcription factor 15 [Citrus sinensis]|nr:GATA transcription factor 15 [Citrus sinensis]